MDAISLPIQAALWGGLAGTALLLGAAVGYFANLPHRVVSGIMAFGTGVLISALSFDLMEEAVDRGGIGAAATGFVIGVLLYSSANAVLDKYGAKHRKRSRKSAAVKSASGGTAIALGALIDGIPESAAIGVSLLDGEGVALVAMLAIFISNVPEGLSSTVGMKRDGKSFKSIFGMWIAIVSALILAAFLGYSVIGSMGPVVISGAIAVAAGAILVMLVQTMIPEAVDDIHSATGPLAATGFLLAFAASRLLG